MVHILAQHRNAAKGCHRGDGFVAAAEEISLPHVPVLLTRVAAEVLRLEIRLDDDRHAAAGLLDRADDGLDDVDGGRKHFTVLSNSRMKRRVSAAAARRRAA